jgi:hypothetical protein
LRNASSRPWRLRRPERPEADVEPGVAVTIRADMTILVDGVPGKLSS